MYSSSQIKRERKRSRVIARATVFDVVHAVVWLGHGRQVQGDVVSCQDLEAVVDQFLSRIWLPRQDPGELVSEREDLHAGVDDGVGLVVRLQHPVVAETLLAGRTATLL